MGSFLVHHPADTLPARRTMLGQVVYSWSPLSTGQQGSQPDRDAGEACSEHLRVPPPEHHGPLWQCAGDSGSFPGQCPPRALCYLIQGTQSTAEQRMYGDAVPSGSAGPGAQGPASSPGALPCRMGKDTASSLGANGPGVAGQEHSCPLMACPFLGWDSRDQSTRPWVPARPTSMG